VESIGDLECEVLKVWCCGTEECEFGGTQLDRYFWRFKLGVRGIGRRAVPILAMKIKFDQGLESICVVVLLLVVIEKRREWMGGS
jgi:hypothetical protein